MYAWIRHLLLVALIAAVPESAAQSARSVDVPTAAALPAAFDADESAALFVGVRKFTHDRDLAEVRFAVDDAVDLAYAFALERAVPLVRPERVALALSGAPQKPSSQKFLEELRAAGASVHPATHSDILALMEMQSRRAGRGGLLIVAFATHGVSAEGAHYLLAASSLPAHRETAVSLNKILDIAAESDALRSLVFVDACRQRMIAGRRAGGGDAASAAPLLAAIGRAHGQAVFFAAPEGQFAWDDEERGNGVFTAAVLDGLRCGAPADPRGFVTVASLAAFVDDRVLAWVRRNRDRNVTRGIQLMVEGGAGAMPVGVCEQRSDGTAASVARLLEQIALLSRIAKSIADAVPAAVRTSDGAFQVLNASGVRLWGGVVDGTIARAELADLDGDDTSEVVVGVSGSGKDVGKILVYGADGALRWARDTTGPSNYAAAQSGRMAVTAIATGDLFRSGKRQIVTASIDAQGWYPARLCILDADGTLLASYSHPGHIIHLAIGAPTAEHAPRIILVAVNNDLRQVLRLDGYITTIAVLDPHRVSGEAPPYFGRSPRGTELWYGVIVPPNDPAERLEIVDSNQDGVQEISLWMTSRTVFYLSFDGDLISRALGDGATHAARFGRLRIE